MEMSPCKQFKKADRADYSDLKIKLNPTSSLQKFSNEKKYDKLQQKIT